MSSNADWIEAVKELPRRGIGVLVWNGVKVTYAWHSAFHAEGKGCPWRSHTGVVRGVTHWMPLPAAPVITAAADAESEREQSPKKENA